MTHPARRYRRWVMGAGPFMVLTGSALKPFAADLALLVWMGIGAALFGSSAIPYGRRRRIQLPRLFLGYAAAVFARTGLTALARPLLSPDAHGIALMLTGAVGLSLILCQHVLRFSPPRIVSWISGGALCAAAIAIG